jgi:hypothetical protein
MVVNTPGGDDDFGAVAIWLGPITSFDTYSGPGTPSDNVISYNRMVRCRATCKDYRHDGGAIEFYGACSRNYIYRNWAEDCCGFLEIGGPPGTQELVQDNVVAYNVMVDNGWAGMFHGQGRYGADVVNMRIENNTIIDRRGGDIIMFNCKATPKRAIYRNNIFYLPNNRGICNQSTYLHENNLYYFGGKTNIAFKFGPGEKIADPDFINIKKKDFRLRKGSPAIDAGVDLKYRSDYDSRPVPVGAGPDIGAFEYIGDETNAKN